MKNNLVTLLRYHLWPLGGNDGLAYIITCILRILTIRKSNQFQLKVSKRRSFMYTKKWADRSVRQNVSGPVQNKDIKQKMMSIKKLAGKTSCKIK
jgi:hypothetical protein